MKKLIVSLLLLATALAAGAQKREIIKLWPDGAPNDNGKRDVPTLTVYHPAQPNGIVIVVCPGGGYGHLALTHEGHDMAPWMTGMGVTYCVLKYRLPYQHREVPQSDAEQALRIVRQHAADWQVSADKVGIMGGSAGGHLAATVATKYSAPEVRPDFQVLLYPVITMDKRYTNGGTHDNLIGRDATEELEKEYSLHLHVGAQTPPAFIALSADDTGVVPRNTLDYVSALLKHHIPTALFMYPTGGHGWGYKDSFAYKQQWTAELERWLETIQ